jgi:fatty acid desaturase
MDPTYIRPLPTRRTRRIIRLQEAGCFAYLVVLMTLVASQSVPPGFFQHVYITAVAIVLLNSVRTLGAHRYFGDGGQMTFLDQLRDSVNYPNRPWITALWGPLGLRFHALHHLFPSMPYHEMGKAHRRLMAHLPANSPYRETVRTTLAESLMELCTRPRATAPGGQSDLGLQTRTASRLRPRQAFAPPGRNPAPPTLEY